MFKHVVYRFLVIAFGVLSACMGMQEAQPYIITTRDCFATMSGCSKQVSCSCLQDMFYNNNTCTVYHLGIETGHRNRISKQDIKTGHRNRISKQDIETGHRNRTSKQDLSISCSLHLNVCCIPKPLLEFPFCTFCKSSTKMFMLPRAVSACLELILRAQAVGSVLAAVAWVNN